MLEGKTAKILRRRIARKTGAQGDCWIWQAYKDPRGYGRLGFPGQRRTILAHRAAYEAWVGPIPAGLELDHLCRTPACVNPAHLEPVTRAENTRRGHRHGAFVTSRGHCYRGHPYDDTNTYTSPTGVRSCRACRRIAGRRHDAKRPSGGARRTIYAHR